MKKLCPGVALFTLVLCAANAQTAPGAPAHDPRIGQLIGLLDQVKPIRETALSPDGQSILWDVESQGGADLELASMSNPSSPRRLTACPTGASGDEKDAVFSPDSQHIAFFSNCTDSGKTGIFLAAVAGTAAPQLLVQLNGYAKELQWSPDGKTIAFLYVEGATRPSGALAAMKPPSGVIGVEGLEVQRVAAIPAVASPSEAAQPSFLTPPHLHV